MQAGIKIVFGTDVGGFSWTEPIVQDFPYMVKFGMSPMEAIRAATTSPAEMLGMTGRMANSNGEAMRRGQPSAWAMGVRMSGADRCAMVVPSS